MRGLWMQKNVEQSGRFAAWTIISIILAIKWECLKIKRAANLYILRSLQAFSVWWHSALIEASHCKLPNYIFNDLTLFSLFLRMRLLIVLAAVGLLCSAVFGQ